MREFKKMKNQISSFLLSTVIFSSHLNLAYSQKRELVGVGLDSCAEFIQERRSQNKLKEIMYLSWIQGQLTTFNMNRGRANVSLVNIPEGDTLLLMVEKKCMNEPQLNVMFAASSLFKELEK